MPYLKLKQLINTSNICAPDQMVQQQLKGGKHMNFGFKNILTSFVTNVD